VWTWRAGGYGCGERAYKLVDEGYQRQEVLFEGKMEGVFVFEVDGD
jgi:hypothetical protein